MRLWLDDERDPQKTLHIRGDGTPNGTLGWTWVKTYDDAIKALQAGEVTYASLDHDIGACDDCVMALLHIGDMETPETTFYNRCPHAKTGYDLICFMEEYEIWPRDGVRVHSMNPVGRARMQQVIDKHYG